MTGLPISKEIVEKQVSAINVKNVGKASIREIKLLINNLEKETGIKFIRMEMGIPGLPAPQIGINAEKEALDRGVASLYPDIDGLAELKHEISRFVKAFLNVDVPAKCCVPSVGSINGAYASFMVAGRMDSKKDTVLLIDPGFPVHKQLIKMIGLYQESFDVYNFRGEKLREKLESILKKGNISTILYSNPNNPTWICFNEEELKIIGELATKYNAIIIEDLAYFSMDFRKDLSKPNIPPYQATVAHYTDNYILLISSSKSLSYAGQRVGMVAISPKLFASNHDGLAKYFPGTNFGHSFVHGAIYNTTAGVSHSVQWGLTAILKAANDGEFNFVESVKPYGKKATAMKKLFHDNGFNIVYDKDVDELIGDGFYFTICYPGLSGDDLIKEFIHYGISAISLSITGSEKQGIRACVSLIKESEFGELENRLKLFKQNHVCNAQLI